MSEVTASALSRRRLFEIIGASVGGAAAYQAMTRLGHAEESPYRGPIKLDGDPKGASVIVLGAGLAGMTTAIELERAGYKVSVLEYNLRPGGRNWTLRGGDVYTELGGATQRCEFDAGLYLNPGPWRIPYHHYAILDYCRRFGVTLEPFIQLNQRISIQPTRSTASRSAFATSRPISTAASPSSWQGDEERGPRRCGVKGGPEILPRRCARSARSIRIPLSGGDIQRLIAAMPSTPEADLARSRLRAIRSGCDILTSRLWRACRVSALRLSNHHVPTCRRHGPDRRGVCAADPGSNSIWRESRRHPAE